jgi:hypothetical protein
MISISSLFEAPNVPNGQANGLTAPFGPFGNITNDNDRKLAALQNLNSLSPDEQAKRMNNLRGEGI